MNLWKPSFTYCLCSVSIKHQLEMKAVFVVCLVICGALAAPEAPIKKVIPVLERTEIHDEVGQFALRYRSGDGTVLTESGALKPTLDGKDYVLVKEGEYSFIADDGKVYRTKYVADEKGFRAEGEHLPKSVVA